MEIKISLPSKTLDRLCKEARELARSLQLREGRDNGCKLGDSGFDRDSLACVLDEETQTRFDAIREAVLDADDDAEVSLADDDRVALVSAWDEGCDAALAEIDGSDAGELQEAGEEGWRICVFGLPGSSHWDWALASPGEADEVSARIYKPGAVGPYDSAILTPAEAAERRWQDGTSVYGATWGEIRERDAERNAELSEG